MIKLIDIIRIFYNSNMNYFEIDFYNKNIGKYKELSIIIDKSEDNLIAFQYLKNNDDIVEKYISLEKLEKMNIIIKDDYYCKKLLELVFLRDDYSFLRLD